MPKQPLSQGRRGAETRQPRVVFSPSHITFSFKYFNQQDPAGQSFKSWLEHNPELVEGLLDKLIYLSEESITVSQQNQVLALYSSAFPDKKHTRFNCPPGLENERWGTIRRIGGQKGRVAGFLRDNVFYLVFLDKDHDFYLSEKK